MVLRDDESVEAGLTRVSTPILHSVISSVAAWSVLVLGIAGVHLVNSTTAAVGSQARPVSPCRLPLTTTITATGQICDSVEIAARITIVCPDSLPLHLVIVLDRSLAMKDHLRSAKQAAHRAIAAADIGPGSQFSVVSHGQTVLIESNWTDDPIVAEGAVNGVSYRAGDDGANPGAALAAASRLLTEVGDRAHALEAVLVIGAGCLTSDMDCSTSVRQGANSIAGTGATMIAVCFDSAIGNCRPYRDAASSSRTYFAGPAYRVDQAIDLVIDTGRALGASEVILEEYVTTSNFRYVLDSGSPIPEIDEGDAGQGLKQILRFSWGDRQRDSVVTATYKLRAASAQSGAGAIRGTGGLSRIHLVDSLGRSYVGAINENPQVPIRPRCGEGIATPTMTSTVFPTAEATITSAPSRTATTVPPEPTRPAPTSLPAHLYLPVALRP